MTAKFSCITRATAKDMPRLFDVWESSVRATHAFLSEANINSLVPLARAEIATFQPIHCLRDDNELPFAMLGVEGTNIEMLFVHADYRGTGAGRLLVEFAIHQLQAVSVDVNEENDQALSFYQHMGFQVTGRSPLDSSGHPYPILHMSLRNE